MQNCVPLLSLVLSSLPSAPPKKKPTLKQLADFRSAEAFSQRSLKVVIVRLLQQS